MTRLVLILNSPAAYVVTLCVLAFLATFAMGAAYELHWSAME